MRMRPARPAAIKADGGAAPCTLPSGHRLAELSALVDVVGQPPIDVPSPSRMVHVRAHPWEDEDGAYGWISGRCVCWPSGHHGGPSPMTVA